MRPILGMQSLRLQQHRAMRSHSINVTATLTKLGENANMWEFAVNRTGFSEGSYS